MRVYKAASWRWVSMPRKVKHAPRTHAEATPKPATARKVRPDAFDSSSDDDRIGASSAGKVGKKGALAAGGLGITYKERGQWDTEHTKYKADVDSTVFHVRTDDKLPWTKAYIVERNEATKRLERQHFKFSKDHDRWQKFVPSVSGKTLPKTYKATKHWISNNDAFKQSFHITIQQNLLKHPEVVAPFDFNAGEPYMHVLASIQKHINGEREHTHTHAESRKDLHHADGSKYTWKEFKEHVQSKPALDPHVEGLRRRVHDVVKALIPPGGGAVSVPDLEGSSSGEVLHFLFTCKRAIMLAVIENIRERHAPERESGVEDIRAQILTLEKNAKGCDANLTELFEHLKSFKK